MLTGVARLVGITMLAGCTAGEVAPAEDPPTAPGSEEHAVRQVLESYYAAFSDRDWPRFADHFWPGATLTTVWTPTGEPEPRVVATSVPEFVAQAPEGPGSREIFEERLVSVTITTQPGLAQAWARYHARFGDPGDVFEWDGTDAFTLLRHDGQWKITSLAYVSDPQ